MNALDAIKKRVSVRKYLKKKIPRAVLKKLADAGRRAPTAMGREPWDFVVVTDRAVIEKLGERTHPDRFMQSAAAVIAVFCRDTEYYLEDGSAATENILLAAAALGLGGCWVAGDKQSYAEPFSRLLGVPPQAKLVSMISLGWPAERPRQVRKRSLRDVLHWETYSGK